MTNYRAMVKGTKIRVRNRIGILLSNAEYKWTTLSGLFYADIEWKDETPTIDKDYLLCRKDMEVLEYGKI